MGKSPGVKKTCLVSLCLQGKIKEDIVNDYNRVFKDGSRAIQAVYGKKKKSSRGKNKSGKV